MCVCERERPRERKNEREREIERERERQRKKERARERARERERVSERERACFVVEFRSALLLNFGLAGDVELWDRLQETI